MHLLDQDELPPLPINAVQRDLAVARALTGPAVTGLPDSVFGHVDHPAVAGSVAVRGPGADLTYTGLATQARRFATLFAAHGVGAGSVVAVGGERGADVVAAFLATELTGAVYLPVDLGWPARRLTDVLTAADARLLVVTGDATMPGTVRGGKPCPAVAARGADEYAPWSGVRVPPPQEPRYVLFTSGSTGRPKGAVVEQQGMLNHLCAKVTDLALTGVDRVAQTAPLVFDISLWQFLAPLLVGAEVHVLPDEQTQDAAALRNVCVRAGITVLEVVPTVLRLLLDEPAGAPRLATLRWLLATGEELPPSVARRVARDLPGVRLLNAYGPTECSDDVTHHVVGDPGEDVAHLPIGGPLANTVLHVLREDGGTWWSCGVGEVGELVVGGTGVGRGYLGESGRTRAAFFRDPFHDTATGRLYRTGDAVIMLAGGVLEYRGRLDRQVKVAGVRMELGEIEAVLGTHPSVAACAVVVRTGRTTLVARESNVGTAGAKQLVAFVCPREEDTDTPVDVEALRAYLTARLPLPMVPQLYVMLPELPLTGNGKVDHAALSARPVTAGPVTAHNPPNDDRERLVAAAMAALLDRDRFGRDESFVAAGGDSLLAIRLIALLRAEGHRITLRDVLLDATPTGVATRLAPAAQSVETTETTATVDGVRHRPLTPQQSGVYFHWRLAPDNPYYSYQGSLRLTGPLDTSRLVTAWRVLLAENPALLARFVDGDEPAHEYPYWMVELPAPTDLGALPQDERESVFRAAARTAAAEPFDLNGAPALRIRSFRMGPDDHRLLVTMHEILLDGWGATVLFGRLAELYADPDAPGDPHRYDRYLARQERALTGDDMVTAAEYWRGQLGGTLPVLELPTAERRTTTPSHRGGIVEQVVDAATTAHLRALAGQSGATPFMVVLAAYSLALGYHCGADEVVVGAPIANREDAESTEVAAFLINMLPLRIVLDPGHTAGAHLAAVRDTVVAGYAAATYPFGWMLRDVRGVVRDSGRTPVFQTMLNLLTYPSREVSARGVTFAFTELDTGFTKYDCSLYVQHHSTDELLLQLAHHVDVVAEHTARGLLESTLLALRAITADPHTPVSGIDLLPASDRALLEEFSHAN